MDLVADAAVLVCNRIAFVSFLEFSVGGLVALSAQGLLWIIQELGIIAAVGTVALIAALVQRSMCGLVGISGSIMAGIALIDPGGVQEHPVVRGVGIVAGDTIALSKRRVLEFSGSAVFADFVAVQA